LRGLVSGRIEINKTSARNPQLEHCRRP
jgi:hypothetical protein